MPPYAYCPGWWRSEAVGSHAHMAPWFILEQQSAAEASEDASLRVLPWVVED